MRDAGVTSRLSALIGQIYDAALDPACWPEFVNSLSDTFKGAAVLISQDFDNTSSNVSVAAGIEPSFLKSYAEHYYRTNLWIPGIRNAPERSVLVGEDVVPTEAYERSEFYNDFWKPQGLYHGVGCIGANDDGLITAASVIRPRGEGEYRPAEMAALQTVAVHLRRSLRISRELAIAAIQRDAALQELERMGTAALIVDGAARMLFANAFAETLLRDGAGIRLVGGQLASPHADGDARLQALIRSAVMTSAGTGHDGGGATALPRGMRRPLVAFVSPAPAIGAGVGPALPIALVFIRDPEAAKSDEPLLRNLFGLTRTEAALAAALADGKSIEDFAGARDVSVHTASTHLKHLMAKTRTRRRAELVALLLRVGARQSKS